MRTLYYCINGILTFPGSSKNWTTRMNSWVNRHTPDGVVADRFEYFCDIFFRNVKQRERAMEIAAEVAKYRRDGYQRIVLVGHSNGCALIGEALQGCGQDVDSVHLFAPAAEDGVFADCIREGQVKRVFIYGSRNDRALRVANALGWLARWVPWTGRYGSLGLRGREFARLFPEVVRDCSNDGYDHGTWFEAGAVFNATMQLVQRNEAEAGGLVKDLG